MTTVFRVPKDKDFTVLKNYVLKDEALTIGARGLFCIMLSLPEKWNYSLRGLSDITKDGVSKIRSAVHELEQYGYLIRRQTRNEKGWITGVEYIIFEVPGCASAPQPKITIENQNTPKPKGRCFRWKRRSVAQLPSDPQPENKKTEKDFPELKEEKIPEYIPETVSAEVPQTQAESRFYPSCDFPTLDKPTSENRTRSNTHRSNTHRSKNSFLSPSSFRKKRREKDRFRMYEEILKENIQYDVLLREPDIDTAQLDAMVSIMLEAVCTSRSSLYIAGCHYPAETVKERFLQLDGEHIRFVNECLSKNTTEIRNIKKYLLTVLFNAPVTMDSYYAALERKNRYA